MKKEIQYNEGDMMVFSDINAIPKDEAGIIRLEMVLVFVCYQGTMQVRMNEVVYEVNRSECFISLPQSSLSRILLSPNASLRVFGFSLTAIDNIFYVRRNVLGHIHEVTARPVVSLEEADLQLMDHLYAIVSLREQLQERTHYRQMMLSLQQSVFYAFADTLNRHQQQDDETEETANTKDQLFKQFLTLLGNSGGKNRSVTEFARQLNITPKYLSVVVREVSGQTPMHWIQDYTMNVIIQRLRYTSKSIKEISNELNFPNTSFFGRFVKEHLGCTPKEYREQHRKEK